LKAALYIRVSTDEQAEEGFSIPAQIKQLTEYCNKNNIDIYKVYADEGVSGQKENRPQFQLMLKDAEKKLFSIILVHKFDRFARKVELSQRIKRQLKTSGVNVISITEPIENSPIGFFQEGILELLAEYYVKNLAQESKKGHIERASQGLHNGSVPYGYTVDHSIPALMSVNYEQAKIVKLIFDLYINKGYGSSKIARILNESSIPSAVNGQWAYYTVNRILHNPKYVGCILYDGKLYEGKHEPIISKEEFDLVKKYAKDRTWKREYRGANFEKFTMLGLLKCGYCGHVMRIQKYTKLHYGYICNNSTHYDRSDRCDHRKTYRVEKLELAIEAKIHNLIKEGYSKSLVGDSSYQFMLSRKTQLEKKWENLNNAYLKDIYTLEYFSKMDKQIKHELSEIKLEPQKTIDIENLWGKYKAAISPTEKRNILKKFIVSIEITENDIGLNMLQF
jgi:site-specific DNA recombinase